MEGLPFAVEPNAMPSSLQPKPHVLLLLLRTNSSFGMLLQPVHDTSASNWICGFRSCASETLKETLARLNVSL